jgi:hypothetical protein
VRTARSGGGLDGGVGKSNLRSVSAETLELGGESRSRLWAGALSKLASEVAGFSSSSDAGDARLREEIGVIAKLAV